MKSHGITQAMVPNDDLAIVLLNWESAHQTLRTIRMLSDWNIIKPLLIIVDNGSSEADRCSLQNGANENSIIFNSHNRGFAGGNNDGIAFAISKGYSKILLLNTDVEVSEKCIIHLVSSLVRNPDIGVIGPLIQINGKIFAGGRNIGLYSNTQIPFKRNTKVSGFQPVDYVSGTVFLFRAELFKKMGGLAEDYFFSGEIADFCHKVRKEGYICAICIKCTAIHDIQMTMLRRVLYPYYSIRNRFLYVERNIRGFSALLIIKWIIAGITYSTLAYLQRDRLLSHSLLLAVKDGLNGRFGNQNERVIPSNIKKW